MNNLQRFGLVHSSVLALLIWSAPAFAVDESAKGAARELSAQAKEDFDAGHFEEAAQKFQKAYELAKVPTLALWSARCASKLGRLVIASELYRQALLLTPNDLWVGSVQQEAQAEAQQELEALIPRIGRLRLVIVGGKAEEVALSIDGVALPSALVGVDRPTDPGKRHVVGTRGNERADIVVELKEHETKEVVLKFSGAPTAAPAQGKPVVTNPSSNPASLVPRSPAVEDRTETTGRGSTQRTLGWISLGIGAAGVVEGAITGIFVIQRYSKLEKDGCSDGVCDPSTVDRYLVDLYNALRTASMVGFIVGGTGLALGTTLLVTSPTPSARVGVYVAPSAVGVHGTF